MKIKNIQKEAFLSNLEKSYSEGVYVDNAQNRKLGRVGMSYKQYRELEMDQEEELGSLYAQGKDKEAEELAQKYGEQLGDLDSEINSLKSKIKELEPKVDKLHEELNSIWDY